MHIGGPPALAHACRQLSRPDQLEVFAGTGHAFLDPCHDTYGGASAAAAWQSIIDVLISTLADTPKR